MKTKIKEKNDYIQDFWFAEHGATWFENKKQGAARANFYTRDCCTFFYTVGASEWSIITTKAPMPREPRGLIGYIHQTKKKRKVKGGKVRTGSTGIVSPCP